MKRLDIWIIVIVLIAAGGYMLWRNVSREETGQLTAEIYLDGELERTVGLPTQGEEELLLETAYGYNLLLLTPESVDMIQADCASQDCVHSPKLTRTGSVIACLPHRLVVRLAGQTAESGEVDFVAG